MYVYVWQGMEERSWKFASSACSTLLPCRRCSFGAMNELEERKWSIYNQPVRFVHVCKCTCFTTNVTLIPIYWPKDGRNLCSTCTKNFCVEQVEGCRGAQIVEANSDTATGFEGQVWAKCFGKFLLIHFSHAQYVIRQETNRLCSCT